MRRKYPEIDVSTHAGLTFSQGVGIVIDIDKQRRNDL